MKVAARAAIAVACMTMLALVDPEPLSGDGQRGLAAYGMLFVAGASGGAAMILPGLSGPTCCSSSASPIAFLCRPVA